MKFADVLRRLDAYPRTLDDFSVRTVGGAAGRFCVYFRKQTKKIIKLNVFSRL